MTIDKTFIISLPSRLTDRLIPLIDILKEKEMGYYVYEAIKNDNGAKGLILTMEKLLTECLEAGYETILVFEDDISFLVDNPKEQIETCLKQLRPDFDLLYLGVNLFQEKVELATPNLIKATSCYSSHAIIYHRRAILKALEAIKSKRGTKQPFDEILVRNVQKDGLCYAAIPMIAEQLSGWSDIEKKNVDYKDFLEKRFSDRTKHLI